MTGLQRIREEMITELYDFQSAIVDWAERKKRVAVFADCGLGKTLRARTPDALAKILEQHRKEDCSGQL